MVNLGIERLKKLVQQPPSNYASTDRDDESVMAATSESEILVENALSSERTQERQEGMPSLAPQSNTINITNPLSAKILQKISCKEKRQQETRHTGHQPDQLSTLKGVWRLWPCPRIAKKCTAYKM